MASLIVDDRDRDAVAEAGVCMRCGRPAAVRKSHTFSWHPQWVIVLLLLGLLPWAIVAIVLTKRKRLDIPFCAAHKNHWVWRQVFAVGGLLFFLLLGFGTIALMSSQPGRGGPQEELVGFLCFGSILLGLGWLVTLAVIQYTAIRPLEITYEAATLTNVSEEFVRAFRHGRRDYSEQVGEYVREHWGRGKPRGEPGGGRHVRGRQDDVVDLPPDAIQEEP